MAAGPRPVLLCCLLALMPGRTRSPVTSACSCACVRACECVCERECEYKFVQCTSASKQGSGDQPIVTQACTWMLRGHSLQQLRPCNNSIVTRFVCNRCIRTCSGGLRMSTSTRKKWIFQMVGRGSSLTCVCARTHTHTHTRIVCM